jgi:trans-aconitate 2-methyltransferase
MMDWDPELYNRFRQYRAEPFDWILRHLTFLPRELISDLGCGTGENTIELARRSEGSNVVGLDSSPAMIERAEVTRAALAPELRDRLTFVLGDFRKIEMDREYSLIFSNAALQWAPVHREILARWYKALAPGGRMVVQMPSNHHETAQSTLMRLAGESRWRPVLGDLQTPSHVVAEPEQYESILKEIGFTEINCYYREFEHPMESPAAIVEFCRATALRPFLDRLPPQGQTEFTDEFTRGLERAYGTRGPLIFRFRRLFLWARRAQ